MLTHTHTHISLPLLFFPSSPSPSPSPILFMQAMDRCHRIGQTKPVLVFRLITAGSVEERMLRRAESKLMLERVVIRNGAFLQDDAAGGGKQIAMGADELRALLRMEVGRQQQEDEEE